VATRGRSERVQVGGHALSLSNLDKVLYPETGTTKADVVAYYAAVAEWMLPHVEGRPATRKRWVHGVDGPVFFEKALPDSAPDWVARQQLQHSDHVTTYPLVDDVATLTWLAQVAALEVHVPQWRFGPGGARREPDRLVLDLDPGEGVGLPECVAVAQLLRPILAGMGLDLVPVTSGSKGVHLYARLDGRQTSDQVSQVAHELARAVEADHPDLVLSTMGKADRRGKVLLDWSQNNGAKTTIAPYSLRGRSRPTVAAPRTWRELASPHLRQLEQHEVLDRLRRRGDPLAALSSGTPPVAAPAADDDAVDAAPRARGHATAGGPSAPAADAGPADRSDQADRPDQPDPPGRADRPDRPDRLAAYRSMRDAEKTREPVPADAPPPSDGRTFVIQEHHARRLHWDFRLEHDGVLVSWALPKGEPDDPGTNHLAVQTEDHPLEYASFEGTIAAGEYGGGEVTIWDSGTYELEKWREGEEVIVVLHGEQRGTRRVALIHTGHGGRGAARNWIVHRMRDADAGGTDRRRSAGRPARAAAPARPAAPDRATAPPARSAAGTTPVTAVAPMLATAGGPADLGDDWVHEMKWDGIRAVAVVRDGAVTFTSRNGNDLTPSYPELAVLAEQVTGDAVLDGEIVAVDERGRPDFGLLQTRMGLTRERDVRRAQRQAPVRYLLFDVPAAEGRSLVHEPWTERRAVLERVVDPGGPIDVPPVFEGDLDAALATSRRLRLEGVVAKRPDSTYVAGRRSRAWVKLKHHRAQEVVVAGWRPGTGRRAGGVGSLLLGVPDGDGLRYVGRVGTGFSDRQLDDLLVELRRHERATSPLVDVPAPDARDARWVTPSRVGEVEFAEWTATRRLRHATWRGWRPDKAPGDVVVED